VVRGGGESERDVMNPVIYGVVTGGEVGTFVDGKVDMLRGCTGQYKQVGLWRNEMGAVSRSRLKFILSYLSSGGQRVTSVSAVTEW